MNVKAADLNDRGDEAREFRHGWISPRLAMTHLGIGSLSALYRLINDWELPHGRLGRLYRFRRDHLDEWVERQAPKAFAVIDKAS